MAKRNPLRRTKEQVQRLAGHNDIPIVNALIGEMDRGCVLTATELLSDVLELYFRAIMAINKASEDDIGEFLLGGFAPLANFAPRISAAYWFGYIGPSMYDALEHIRVIRNHCAHRAGPITLTDSEIAKHVRAIELFVSHVVKQNSYVAMCCERYFSPKSEFYGKRKFSGPRRTFMKAIYILQSSIHYCSLSVRDDHKPRLKTADLPGYFW